MKKHFGLSRRLMESLSDNFSCIRSRYIQYNKYWTYNNIFNL